MQFHSCSFFYLLPGGRPCRAGGGGPRRADASSGLLEMVLLLLLLLLVSRRGDAPVPQRLPDRHCHAVDLGRNPARHLLAQPTEGGAQQAPKVVHDGAGSESRCRGRSGGPANTRRRRRRPGEGGDGDMGGRRPRGRRGGGRRLQGIREDPLGGWRRCARC